MRNEIQRSVDEQNGWCKEAIEKMLQVDSFIQECISRYPISAGTCISPNAVLQTKLIQ